MSSTILMSALNLLMLLAIAWVVGTAIWILIVVPGMHKQQRKILQRLDALEEQSREAFSSNPPAL
jgi:hypothetical protein